MRRRAFVLKASRRFFCACYYHLIHVVIFFSCGCWIVLSTVFLYVIIILFMLLYSSAAVAGLSCPQYFSMLLSSYSCCYILQLRLLDCHVHSISLCYYHLIHVVIFFSCGCWIVLSTVFLYVIIILFMLLYSSAAVAGLSCPQYFSMLLSSYSCCYILQLRLLDCPVHSISLCYYHLIHVVIFFSCGCWIVLSTVFLYVIIILFMLLYSSAAVAGLSCPQYFSMLLTCLVCLRRRTRSITNERSPGCSILRCCHGIAQGQLGVIDDLVGPAEWWTSSWAVPC